MYEDKVPRLIYYHDTWISVDPIKGCPYECVYCVLRHSEKNKARPEAFTSVEECVRALQAYEFYVPGQSYLAIGNETDMFHPFNQGYLLELLRAFSRARINNPIVLVTKSPITQHFLDSVAAIPDPRLIFALSYSGLGRKYEPNFHDADFRRNFEIVHISGFPIIHYWRPLLPVNTHPEKIRKILRFVSGLATATVFVGLKLHPQLNRILTQGHSVPIPEMLLDSYGEWLAPETVADIYRIAAEICPDHPIYRHTSCAMASILRHPNKTATVYRTDICPPSQCANEQRAICQEARRIPEEEQVQKVLAHIGKLFRFTCASNKVAIEGQLTQEEYAFVLHQLNFPIEVQSVRFENLYRGSIFQNQKAID